MSGPWANYSGWGLEDPYCYLCAQPGSGEHSNNELCDWCGSPDAENKGMERTAVYSNSAISVQPLLALDLAQEHCIQPRRKHTLNLNDVLLFLA